MFFGIDLTSLIQILGYPGLFAIIMAESGLFFAIYLPGGSLLFTAGLLASQGFLNIYILLPTVIIAAILGDTIGYAFGSWVGPALWRRPDSRFFKKKYLEQTRHFFQEHGTRTIFLARFIPIVRTFAPILAGVGEMHYRTFFFYNALGAVIWGGGFVLGGYFLGEIAPGVDEYLELFILGIVFVTMIPFFLHVWKAHKAQSSPKPAEVRVILFDLDETLADSFTPPSQEMLAKVASLARILPVAIISGAAFQRVKESVMDRISLVNDVKPFYVLTDSAGNCHRYEKGSWREMFSYPIAPGEHAPIRAAIKESIEESGIFTGERDASRILERPTSIAFTALPEGATQLEKRTWDPTGEKREKLSAVLRTKLPGYEILIGGKTTIDITREGVNKAHGVEWLAQELEVTPRDMLFVGDAFYVGGNDAVVIPTGIQTLQTSGPDETAQIIDDLLRKLQ